jgi:hypothetical protein
MRALADLCAGSLRRPDPDDAEHSKAMRQLHRSIVQSGNDLLRHLDHLDRKANRLAAGRVIPLVARKLVEECATANLGRLDPLRLVVAYKGSRSDDFEMGERNESSIAWSREIVGDFKPGSGTWTQLTLKKGIVRALMDGQLGSYVFGTSHAQVLDALDQTYRNRVPIPLWASRIQQFSEGRDLLSDLRRRATSCYSCLSKGIHFEFHESGSDLDRATLLASIDDALYVVTTVSLYSHLCDMALRKLQPPALLSRFDAVAHAFVYVPQAHMESP